MKSFAADQSTSAPEEREVVPAMPRVCAWRRSGDRHRQEHALAKFRPPHLCGATISCTTPMCRSDLRTRGATVELPDEVLSAGLRWCSARTVRSKALREEADRWDSAQPRCHLVLGIQGVRRGCRLAREGYEFIMIGPAAIREVEGVTMGA